MAKRQKSYKEKEAAAKLSPGIIVLYILLILFCLLVISPLLIVVSSSFREPGNMRSPLELFTQFSFDKQAE